MEKKSKKIVADFANNPMPERVQEQFRRWMSEHPDDPAIEEQLMAEWNSTMPGSAGNLAYDRAFGQLMDRIHSAAPNAGAGPEAQGPAVPFQTPAATLTSTAPAIPAAPLAASPAPNAGAGPEAQGPAVPFQTPAAPLAASPASKRRPFPAGVWRRMAAAVMAGCAVLGLGAWGAHLFLQPENGVYVVTGEDNKGRFVLPDGTQVWLNNDSRLYYPESFNGERRVVRLEGEGLFNVTHDAARPFEVQTGLMNVEVLGTVFDLKCYGHQDFAEVVLVSGSVKATCGSQQPVTLSPNDRLVAYRNSRKLTYQSVDANNYDKWMFEKQRLDQLPLEDIFVNLEHRYNVAFDIAADVNLTPRLTLSLRSEPLEEILDAISLIVPIRYQIGQGRVAITPK